MTNAVSMIGLTQSAPQPAAPAGAGAGVSANTVSAAATLDSKPLAPDPDTPISPRITVDPFAGVITEFLNTSGQVQSQIPSAAVVAYLRAGLNADGQVKQEPGQSSQLTQPEAQAQHEASVVA